MDNIRVVILHETELIINMLKSVLEQEEGIEVLGEYQSITEALRHPGSFEVALVSSSLPSDGTESYLQQIAESNPETHVIVVGLADSETRILELIESGADGYVLKEHDVDDLLERIRGTVKGKGLVSRKVTRAMMDRLRKFSKLFSQVKPAIDKPSDLTPREQEILNLLGDDLTNQQIADELHIELGTVKNHVHSILSKLDVENREQAAAYLGIKRTQKSLDGN